MRFDTVTVHLAEHWLPALINGDYSGLEDGEVAELEAWAAANPCDHYSPGADLGFTRDDVSGLLADCVEVDLMTAIKED